MPKRISKATRTCLTRRWWPCPDLIPGKAEAFMKRYGVEGVRFYPDHKAMIDTEELDAVSVCTYNTPTRHARFTR